VPLELADQRAERALEQPAKFPRGGLMAEQRLGVAQIVVRLPPDRGLQGEALG
jgi:hypothetical protein